MLRLVIADSKKRVMSGISKLRIIKLIHTLIWVFFNFVIFYMLYLVLADKIGKWLWIGFGLLAIEGSALIIYGLKCPLTIIARKYSNSSRDNFDIYLPRWLAKYTKLIYTTIVFIIMFLTIWRLLQ